MSRRPRQRGLWRSLRNYGFRPSTSRRKGSGPGSAGMTQSVWALVRSEGANWASSASSAFPPTRAAEIRHGAGPREGENLLWTAYSGDNRSLCMNNCLLLSWKNSTFAKMNDIRMHNADAECICSLTNLNPFSLTAWLSGGPSLFL